MNLTNLNIRFDSVDYPIDLGWKGEEFLQSTEVLVSNRRIRATWTPEMVQDVSAFHNIDAEAELTALLSEQIAAEVDREIIREIHTRYANRPVNPNYYGRITIGDSHSDIPGNITPTFDFGDSSPEIHFKNYSGGIKLL